MASSMYSSDKLQRVVQTVGQGLVEREEAVRLLVLAALAGEHLLLVGPPGTAKSELAKRLHRIFGGRYFERLLTRFSVPEELFGPLSLAALDEGRYERDVDGYLPRASVAFLDEVFKANSAILNALLTLLNEREFDQGATRLDVPLISLVAASNEVPDDETLRAFQDRFLLRATVSPVSDSQFSRLLATEETSAQDQPLLSEADIKAITEAAGRVELTDNIAQLLGQLRSRLRDKQIEISDRRWVRAVNLLKVSAATHGREAIALDDLWLIKALCGERADHARTIEDWFCELLGAQEVLDPQWSTRVVDAFDKQFELEESATELAFDDSGKLSLLKRATAVDDETIERAAPRMSAFSQRKLYSATHIAARIDQIEQAASHFKSFLDDADAHRARIDKRVADNLWMPPALGDRLHQTLTGSIAAVQLQYERLNNVLNAYRELPLAESDDGLRPEPVPMPESAGSNQA